MSTKFETSIEQPTPPALASVSGSTAPDQHASELREAFKTMEEEQWEDYQEYLHATQGTGKSTIKASRPVR
jgi:hypothetical protein